MRQCIKEQLWSENWLSAWSKSDQQTFLHMSIESEVLLQSPRISNREREACTKILENFQSTSMPLSDKAANFTNWARTRDIARFLARFQLFQLIETVPGCIFECGVHYGGGLSSWQHLSEIYEPVNFTRRIFGFDTFEGFPNTTSFDCPTAGNSHSRGDFTVEIHENLIVDTLEQIEVSRKIHVPERFNIVKGDISQTLPALLESDASISIALLYLDLDLYEPTVNVLKTCLPRLPKGSLVVFDEYADPNWPGETRALSEVIGINNVRMRCFSQIPRISYFVVD